LRRQILVGGRDDADVDGDRFRAADALEPLLLQDAQQFRLDAGGHFANLVEE
jgi:hypothetical protein